MNIDKDIYNFILEQNYHIMFMCVHCYSNYLELNINLNIQDIIEFENINKKLFDLLIKKLYLTPEGVYLEFYKMVLKYSEFDHFPTHVYQMKFSIRDNNLDCINLLNNLPNSLNCLDIIKNTNLLEITKINNLPTKLVCLTLSGNFNLDYLPENLKILLLYPDNKYTLNQLSNLPIGLNEITINDATYYSLEELINDFV